MFLVGRGFSFSSRFNDECIKCNCHPLLDYDPYAEPWSQRKELHYWRPLSFFVRLKRTTCSVVAFDWALDSFRVSKFVHREFWTTQNSSNNEIWGSKIEEIYGRVLDSPGWECEKCGCQNRFCFSNVVWTGQRFHSFDKMESGQKKEAFVDGSKSDGIITIPTFQRKKKESITIHCSMKQLSKPRKEISTSNPIWFQFPKSTEEKINPAFIKIITRTAHTGSYTTWEK